jgi:hypothetical protein
MPGFEVEPAAMRGNAEGLDDVVDDFAESLARFENTINGFGEPWGADDIGTLIGELYLGIHDLAMSCFESNGEVLGQFADGLHTMADNFERAEQDIATGLQRIQNQLGRG